MLLFPLTTFIPAPLYDRPNIIVTVTSGSPAVKKKIVSTVLIIGSSIAAGWGDDNHGGYLIRALADFAHRSNQSFHILNWAIPGVTTTDLALHFQAMINKSHPNIVILSWGGLDDAAARTPVAKFIKHVKNEVKVSQDARAVVLIVTPPVTPATYGNGLKDLPHRYFQAQIQTFRDQSSRNVYVFDVFDQMMQYIRNHHLVESKLAADGWHPNPKGHAIAAKLLFNDMIQQFKRNFIVYKVHKKLRG